MIRVARRAKQTLVFISGFSVEISFDKTIFYGNHDIEERPGTLFKVWLQVNLIAGCKLLA